MNKDYTYVRIIFLYVLFGNYEHTVASQEQKIEHLNFEEELNRSLVHFAKEGNAVKVTEILATRNGNLNTWYFPSSDDKYSALEWAVKKKHIQVVSQLLQAGIDVNNVNIKGRTALYSAGKSMIPTLLQFGANICIQDVEGNTILHKRAGKYFDCDIFRALLNHDFNAINYQNNNGETCLLLAIKKQNKGIIGTLLRAENIDIHLKDRFGHTAIYYAIRTKQCKVVQKLLDLNAHIYDADGKGTSILLLTLQYYSKKNSEKDKKFIINIATNFPELCTQANNSNKSPLYAAIVHCEDNDVITRFIDTGQINSFYTGTHIQSYGNTPLMAAVYKGNEKIVQLLLDKGADVNTHSINGKTALLYACSLDNSSRGRSNPKIIQMLLDAGADVECCDPQDQMTPLLLSIYNGYADIAGMLIDEGADCNACNTNGNSALLLTLQLIYETNKKCKKDWCKYSGTRNKFIVIANKLLHSGVDVTIKNKSEDNALSLARRYGCTELIPKILLHGAELSEVKDSFIAQQLSRAVVKKDYALIRLLLNQCFFTKRFIRKLLIDAIKDDSLDVAMILFSVQDFTQQQDIGLFMNAVRKGCTDIVETLLYTNDYNSQIGTAIREARNYNQESIVAVLARSKNNL